MGYNNHKREQQSELNRQKIYMSALKLFVEHGSEVVSVDDIVRDAKVAKGSFYLHYKSKDQLLALIIQDQVKQKDNHYRQFISTLDSNNKAGSNLLCFTEYIVDVLMNEVGHRNMGLIYKFSLMKTVETESVMNYQRDIYQIIYELLSRGIREGEFSDVFSADMLANHCMILLRGITFEWCARYKDFDFKAEALKHVKIFLQGITSKQ